MRNKLGLTVVDTTSFHAENTFRLAQVLSCDGVVYDIYNAADGAICVEQRGWALDYFDLFDVKQVHVHTVICPQTGDVACPSTIAKNFNSVAC